MDIRRFVWIACMHIRRDQVEVSDNRRRAERGVVCFGDIGRGCRDSDCVYPSNDGMMIVGVEEGVRCAQDAPR